MTPWLPQYVLFSDTLGAPREDRWRFVLRTDDGSTALEVEESEPGVFGERLQLLAVVRGLEALEQPSKVTLVTASDYVTRGLAHGLDEWRANAWNWEYFGQMAPVKHKDLWQRLDQALRFHQVRARRYRVDGPHAKPDRPRSVGWESGRATARSEPALGGATEAELAAEPKLWLARARLPRRVRQTRLWFRRRKKASRIRWVRARGWLDRVVLARSR